MFRTPTFWAALGLVACQAATARAAEPSSPAAFDVVFGVEAPTPLTYRSPEVWRVDFGATSPMAATAEAPPPSAPGRDAVPAQEAQAPIRRPVAYVYSDAYELRAKIHKYSSFLTLPLFGAQFALGLKLDEGTRSEPVRATHAAIATTMVGLFTVNTVTGVWNLIEGRQSPNGKMRRLVHGLLMLASDAGFVATGLTAPTNDGGGNRGVHKGVAIASIGTATAGYLLMLFGQ